MIAGKYSLNKTNQKPSLTARFLRKAVLFLANKYRYDIIFILNNTNKTTKDKRMDFQEAFEHLKANYKPEDERDNEEPMILGFSYDPSDTDPPFFMIELLYEPHQHRSNGEGYYADIKFSDLPETHTSTVRCFACTTIDELLACLPDYAANLNYQSYEPDTNAFDGAFQYQIKEVFSTLASINKENKGTLKGEAIKAINRLNDFK